MGRELPFPAVETSRLPVFVEGRLTILHTAAGEGASPAVQRTADLRLGQRLVSATAFIRPRDLSGSIQSAPDISFN